MANTENWQACRKMIRDWLMAKAEDKALAAHVWDVWFKDITLYSYDSEQAKVTLLVPNVYVYEYVEQLFRKAIWWAVTKSFDPCQTVQYKVSSQEPSFSQVAQYLQQHSAYDSKRDPFHIRIPDARRRLEECVHDLLGDKAQWLSGYDRVADWLTDNKGRGLLCVGQPSTGKSFLCTKILPVILGNGGRPIPIVDAVNLRGCYEELKQQPICIIDDLGKDDRRYFGNTDNSFFELCNNAERTGNLLIITTILSPNIIDPCHPDAALYPDSIERRYGRDVLDRLKVITNVAVFKGECLRK